MSSQIKVKYPTLALILKVLAILLVVPFTVVGFAHVLFGVDASIATGCAAPFSSKQDLAFHTHECCKEEVQNSNTHTFELPPSASGLRQLENGNYAFEFEGQTIEAPPGSVIEIEKKLTQEQIGERNELTLSGNSRGASLETDDRDTAKSFENQAPSMDFGSMSSTGGSTSFSSKMQFNNSRVLWFMGGIAVLGGIALATVGKRLTWGLTLAGGGVVLITLGFLVEQAPWLLLFAVAGVIGYFIYSTWDARNRKLGSDALSALTRSTNEIKQADDIVKKWFERFKDNLRPTITNRSENSPKDIKREIFQLIDNAYTQTEQQKGLVSDIFQYLKDRVKNNADNVVKDYIQNIAPRS